MLDGGVLVVSAVEGVQPQTRILMRALQRLRMPALLFVNKIDRTGAQPGDVLGEISAAEGGGHRDGRVDAAGTRGARFIAPGPDDAGFMESLAELLAERDDGLLAAYLRDEAGVPSAGCGPRWLLRPGERGVPRLLRLGGHRGGRRTADGRHSRTAAGLGRGRGRACVRGHLIDRGGSARRSRSSACSGTVSIRDRLRFGAGLEGRVTAVAVFERGAAVPRPSVRAGQIAKLRGLAGARIGDPLGELPAGDAGSQFPPPTLESAVVPPDPATRRRLRAALGQLAEQDPLINLRQNDERQEIYVSLYGEVQKEDRVRPRRRLRPRGHAPRDDDDLHRAAPAPRAHWRSSSPTPIPIQRGRAALQTGRPIPASVRLDVEPRLLPLFIYKTFGDFTDAMTQYIGNALREGLHGWRVTDCIATMNVREYYIGKRPAKRVLPTPRTTAADFHKLTR